MKVSIITVCFNSEKTIEQTILSVLDQEYSNIEYLIIDGQSTDNTMSIVKKYKNKIDKIVCEKDNGIYDAMNKGIELSTGSLIGILNSDDIFSDKTIVQTVVDKVNSNDYDCLYGNIFYFRKNPKYPVRIWKSANYFKFFFECGFVPPHPGLFVKKDVYKKIGMYKTSFCIAGDQEFMIRMLKKYSTRSIYLNKYLVKMRLGGVSSKGLKSFWQSTFEIKKAWSENGFNYPIYLFFFRPISKFYQYTFGMICCCRIFLNKLLKQIT